MATTYSLRDLGISPGQATTNELELELPPYVQGGESYAVASDVVPAVLDVTAMTQGTSFRLRFDASYEGPCARCLEPATFVARVDVHMVHDPDAQEDDLRSEHVDDVALQLDVTSWAREEVGLRFPSRVICQESCLGLCPQCGVNRNDDPDHAHEVPTDSRWDALKGLQLDEGDEG